jgi:hypothetical protein
MAQQPLAAEPRKKADLHPAFGSPGPHTGQRESFATKQFRCISSSPPSGGVLVENPAPGSGRSRGPLGSGRAMSIIATIMNSATGQPIQKMTFGRMPKPWASFNLETGELVTADRVHVGKPAPGKFVAPVEVWVTPKA